MKRKNGVIDEKILLWCLDNTEIPYQVDNMFYETFGMSYDDVLESLCADSIDIMTSFS